MTPRAVSNVLSDYLEECERLRAENHELRQILWALLRRDTERNDLLKLAREEIRKRWQ